jgi:hypothetical protein
MRRNINRVMALIVLITAIAWSERPVLGLPGSGQSGNHRDTSPDSLAAGEMLFEFNDLDVQHDMGCGGTGNCLVAELMEIVSASGVFIGTAREEVYEITPKLGPPGVRVRAKLFFTFVDNSGGELGKLQTDEFVVDAATAEIVPATGQLKLNTWWDGTVHGTSGMYTGQSGNIHMRGHNVVHPDPATGVFIVDQFFNTYVVSGLR